MWLYLRSLCQVTQISSHFRCTGSVYWPVFRNWVWCYEFPLWWLKSVFYSLDLEFCFAVLIIFIRVHFTCFLIYFTLRDTVISHNHCCCLSSVWLFCSPPWIVALYVPLSIGFSSEEYRSGLPFPSPGDLPDPGVEPKSPVLAGGFFTTKPPGKPLGFSWQRANLPNLSPLRCPKSPCCL